jgi:hypothetical protein
MFAVWLLVYLAVVLSWGQRNSWPDELLVCVAFLPAQILVAALLYQRHGFDQGGVMLPSHRELAIAYLLLAIGIASGLLLMMVVGLLAVALAWLRPARRQLDWLEWLKVPVIFAMALPFWLDFAGSRQEWYRPFADPAVNPPYQFPLALTLSRLEIILRLGVLAAALVLPGRRFWWGLPLLLPLLLGVNHLGSRALAAAGVPAGSATEWALYALQAAAFALLAAATAGLEKLTRRPPGAVVTGAMESYAYPPWVAAMVVAVQQAVPAEGPALRPQPGLELLGMVVLVALLYRLRWRTAAGPVHSRSSGMVVVGLALLLVAEFTGLDLVRYAALGATLAGLISWHRRWPRHAFAVAFAVWTALLPPPAATPLEPALLTTLRVVIAVAGLAWLAYAPRRGAPAPEADTAGYANEAWQPLARFSLVLLLLMLVFQNASAFWPEPMENRFEQAVRGATATDLLAPPGPATTNRAPADPWSAPRAYGRFEVTVALPSSNPAQLEAPELALQRRGWTVRSRALIRHPRGEAVHLHLERRGEPAHAVYWFENGPDTFSNYLQARRILWSSWNLADRNLRLVLLLSRVAERPDEFYDFAARQNWFDAPLR